MFAVGSDLLVTGVLRRLLGRYYVFPRWPWAGLVELSWLYSPPVTFQPPPRLRSPYTGAWASKLRGLVLRVDLLLSHEPSLRTGDQIPPVPMVGLFPASAAVVQRWQFFVEVFLKKFAECF